jgi:hypothetical protein
MENGKPMKNPTVQVSSEAGTSKRGYPDPLPSNVTYTRGTSVKRFGVKMRFKGFPLRVGSRYCSPQDAGLVATVFRKIACLDKSGSIGYRKGYKEKYSNQLVSMYLPFTITKDTLPVTSFLDRWLSEWKAKQVFVRKKKKAESALKRKREEEEEDEDRRSEKGYAGKWVWEDRQQPEHDQGVSGHRVQHDKYLTLEAVEEMTTSELLDTIKDMVNTCKAAVDEKVSVVLGKKGMVSCTVSFRSKPKRRTAQVAVESKAQLDNDQTLKEKASPENGEEKKYHLDRIYAELQDTELQDAELQDGIRSDKAGESMTILSSGLEQHIVFDELFSTD